MQVMTRTVAVNPQTVKITQKQGSISILMKIDFTLGDSAHDDSESIECNICGKSYKRKAHLLRHLMSHKSENDSDGNNYRRRHYIFVCNKCGKRFSKSKALQNHENEGTCVQQEVRWFHFS